MGITYEELDTILEAIKRGDAISFSPDQVAKVEQMIADSAHKRHLPWTFLGC